MMNLLKPRSQRGQALILIAVAFVVLLAFIGLTTDVGQLFIYMGHLRRATDAASLAAAAQYREGRTMAEMTAAAEQVMELNGVPTGTYTVTVQTCETTPGDPQLCTTPRRKLVRVDSVLEVPMSFLQLVGVPNTRVSSNSIGEAASLDVVLVIDTSESMTWDAATNNMRDPAECNQPTSDPLGVDGFPGDCQPFQEVKRAAIAFTSRILNKPAHLEEDRLAIVTFSRGWNDHPANKNLGSYVRTAGWTTDSANAQQIIRDLLVFQPGPCWLDEANLIPDQFYGSCRDYDENGVYQQFDCLSCVYPDQASILTGTFLNPIDLSGYTSTNIGGGLMLAGNMFALQTRQEALWVVVLLTDGMANATFLDSNRAQDWTDPSTYPLGFCPNDLTVPLCQDEDVSSRHGTGNANYDSDDYARDMADFVGCDPLNPAAACGGTHGQGAVMFAVGLGDGPQGVMMSTNEVMGRPYGASLLRYIAAVGYDGDSSTDPCDSAVSYAQWCGNYYFAPQGPQLTRIFEDIASRIFTRIVH